jgi:hypothetical protein
MRFQARGVVAGALLLTGCGLFGGGSLEPSHCEIRVVGVETWQSHDEGLDAAYRVRGKAGGAATTWLAAETGPQRFVSGYGLDVGPGPFDAIVDLKLTGRPRRFLAVLDVGGQRCKADAPIPGSDS